jgi:hypothetical protein
MMMPSIGVNKSLAIMYGLDSVTLQVISGSSGDYNGNGVVDAADYDVWLSRLGIKIGIGAAPTASLPEPCSLSWILLCIPAFVYRRRRFVAR